MSGQQSMENQLLEAVHAVRSGACKNLLTASRDFAVPYHTLRNRYLGKCENRRAGHKRQMLLNDAQETVLVEWIQFLGATGHPISKQTIRPKVHEMCGTQPLQNWIRLFLRRHPEVKLGRPSGLDPKRARAFNLPVVRDYFTKLGTILEEKGILWENIWNMDEKGIQIGGGRRSNRRKYFFSRQDRQRCKKRSANLELLTVIECISAAGCTAPPGFIFQGSVIDPESFEVDPNIW